MFDHLQTATWVALVVGYAAPYAAALLTHAHAPAWVFGATTTFFSALAGVIPTVVWNPHDSVGKWVSNVFAALLATFLSHQNDGPSKVRQVTGTGIGKAAA
jgi:hypothetical protein